jgi:hypothetical protein
MKISCNILGTSKNTNRLRVLTANAIRSHKHEITMNFMAEGERPDFLPKGWNWIKADQYRVSDRHVHALIDGVANESFDYNIFCDDDVIIDVDKFVEMAESQTKNPCVWSTHPGEHCNHGVESIIKRHAEKYTRGRQISHAWLGFCTSVINRELCTIARRDKEMLDCLLKISRDISKGSFIPDLQISILGFLAGAEHSRGMTNMGTCWPDFANSSLLVSGGLRWHIHATGESPMVPPDSLMSALKKAPFANEKEMLLSIHPMISRGVKAKDFVGKPFNLAWFWRSWRSRINCIDPNDLISRKCIMHADGTLTSQDRGDLAGKWDSCDGGWKITSPGNMSTTEFFGMYDNKIAVGVSKSHMKGHVAGVFMAIME